MPLISYYDLDDGRVSCKMMAETTLKCLSDPDGVDDHFVELENAYRMLKSYKLGVFGTVQPYGIGQAVLHNDLEEDDSEVDSGRLIDAFERAKRSVLLDIPKEEAANFLQESLQSFINHDLDMSNAADLEKTKKFFAALSTELSV